MVKRGLAAILASLVWVGMAVAEEAQAADPRLTVEGGGTVAARPDMATLGIGVDAQAPTPSEAAEAMAAHMSAVVAALRDTGLEERDIRTGVLSLNPVFAEPPEDRGGAPEIASYIATNEVTVRIRDIDRVGEILDAGVSQGATRFGGLVFGLADPAPVEDAALAEAMADALRKARLVADAGGLTLGDIVEVAEMGGDGGPQPMMEMRAMQSDIPVAPGEMETSARVRVSFAILP